MGLADQLTISRAGAVPIVAGAVHLELPLLVLTGSAGSITPAWRPACSAGALAGDVARFLGREHQARGRDRPQARLAALTRASVDSGAA